MDQEMKSFLQHLKPRKTRALAQTHLTRLELDGDKQETTLFIDKRYAYHSLISQEHMAHVINGVRKSFGDEWEVVVKLEDKNSNHEREKNLPHTIHYQ